MKISRCLKFAVVSLALLGSSTDARAVDEDAESKILAQIVEGGRAFEAAYLGSFSRREVNVRVFDGDSEKVESTRDMIVDVWEYHGESPINEVRECKINDEVVKTSKCVEKRRIDPPHRLFGADSEKYYRFEYRGLEDWNGQSSHKIGIVPLDDTMRHLKGHVFFLADELRVVGMDVTLADYPFGLKDLAIRINMTKKDDKPVIDGGVSRAHIYVPLLINERTESRFKASKQRLLVERDVAKNAPQH